MHPYPVGTKVETTDEYYKIYGRKVSGVSVATNPLPPNHLTVVRWDKQEGSIIPVYAGNNVMMASRFLQKQK